MRGRKPTPTSEQLAKGDPRKKGVHKLETKLESEPKAMRGLPSCPRHLRGRARAAWGFWVAELEAMSLDRRPDAMMLEGACVGYARAVQCDLLVERDGPTVEESMIDKESGERIVLKKTRANPAVGISERAWKQTHSFCSEFGLSPVSRMRLAIENKDDASAELASLLSKPRESRPAVN